MRNKTFLAGMLAMVLAFGFAACGDNGGGDDTRPTGGNAGIPGTADGSLSFENQQVWTLDWVDNNNVWAQYTGSRPGISCWNLGGTGAITNGRLNFSIISVPAAQLRPLEDHELFGRFLDEGGTISVDGVQHASLDLGRLERGYLNRREVSNSGNFSEGWIFERVYFLYVDSDVTFSFPGGRNGNFTTRAFNVDLQQGWNALHWQETETVRETATSTWNVTETLHVGNPARLKWTMGLGFPNATE